MYMAISFSHHNADIALREKLHFSYQENLEILPKIFNIKGVLEAIVLSTCNRCEIYVYIDSNNQSDHDDIALQILRCLSDYKDIESSELIACAKVMCNLDAIHHVFCVASSLLSVVIGETQISGQLKVAYKLSYDNHFCSKFLTRLIHFAFRCAASVRRFTDISKNPISVASVASNIAIDFIRTKHNKSPKILIIGVGEMGVLSLKHLIKHSEEGIAITLCNRTKEKAQDLLHSLSLQHSVSILDFLALDSCINDYDVVISAVANGSIIDSSMIRNMPFDRLFIDLSMPRNFSFDMHDLENLGILKIDIISIDDLKTKASAHIYKREQSAKAAMGIVGKFTQDFSQWIAGLGVVPLIKTMRLQAKKASLKEIDKAIKKGFIPEALRDNVTKLVHNAFNEFLHAPTIRLKEISEDEHADSILEGISNVFGAQDRILLNRYKCEYDDVKQN